jgi:hypothetical protein
MKLTVYYNVGNGGDGSAYPQFFESMELAEWDEEHEDEGWGEPSTGKIEFESDSPIICIHDKITTKEKYFIKEYIDSYEPDENERDEFLKKFFPGGFPKCTSTVEKLKPIKYPPGSNKLYSYHHIFIDGKEIIKIFKEQSVSAKTVLDTINKFSK